MKSEAIIANRYTRIAVVPLLGTFMFVISACGEGETPASGRTDAAAATPAANTDGVIVEIDFDEFTILMDLIVPASTVWETERRLSPGERRTVTLDFEPGRNKAVCNFSGHEDRGMFTEFMVEETTTNESGSGR